MATDKISLAAPLGQSPFHGFNGPYRQKGTILHRLTPPEHSSKGNAGKSAGSSNGSSSSNKPDSVNSGGAGVVTTNVPCGDIFVRPENVEAKDIAAGEPVGRARKGLAKLGLVLEQGAVEGTPAAQKAAAEELGVVRQLLHDADQWLTKKLRLDEMVFELGVGVQAGVPGIFGVGVTPTLVLSGAKRAKGKRVNFFAAPSAGLQAFVATGSIVWIPGAKRPFNHSYGLGPVKYRPHDSIHGGPFVGLSVPMVGGVIIGPRLLGLGMSFGIPWVNIAKWSGGVFISHPWLEPVCGAIWRGGEYVIERAKTLTAPARDALRPYVQKAWAPVKALAKRVWEAPVVKSFRGLIDNLIHRKSKDAELEEAKAPSKIEGKDGQ